MAEKNMVLNTLIAIITGIGVGVCLKDNLRWKIAGIIFFAIALFNIAMIN
jgi:hypothetical protein